MALAFALSMAVRVASSLPQVLLEPLWQVTVEVEAPTATFISAFLASVALQAAAEELFFRGGLLRLALALGANVRSAILVTSALFAAGHVAPATIVFAFLWGVATATAVARGVSLFVVAAAHAAFNLAWHVTVG